MKAITDTLNYHNRDEGKINEFLDLPIELHIYRVFTSDDNERWISLGKYYAYNEEDAINQIRGTKEYPYYELLFKAEMVI